jgi:hypothetical protein
MARRKKQPDRERLQALIAEATVDCYDEYEQHTGLLTMIEAEVACPFRAKVIGEEVQVLGFEAPRDGFGLNAVCRRQGKKYKIDVGSLEWINPRPQGFEWLEAYLLWRDGMTDGGVDEDE